MSRIEVSKEIDKFLNSTEAEVLCIKGEWGVGKTHTWKELLEKARINGQLMISKYSYVSLFGQNSLDDLRYSIFENTEDLLLNGEEPNCRFRDEPFRWVKNNWRKYSRWTSARAAKSPFIKDYLGETERSIFYHVKNQIICIDDFERVGDGLGTMDILGLVSQLKEEPKNCKVVLLLNYNQIDKKRVKIFDEQLEKVADKVMTFDPTPEESADVVFKSKEGFSEVLHKNCVLLGIKNIRVIKKIEKTCKELKQALSTYHPGVLKQAISSAILFGWVINQPHEAPTIQFIKKHNGLGLSIKGDDKLSDIEKSWNSILSAYGYISTDDFDLALLSEMEQGYFSMRLNTAAEKLNSQMIKSEQTNSFSRAWDLYHDSFKTNEKEVLDAIYSAAIENVDIIDPSNLNSTVTFLKKFDRGKEAKKLLSLYISKRGTEQDLFDTRHRIFRSEPGDPDVEKAFEKVRKSFNSSGNPKEILERIVTQHGWNPEDIRTLSRMKVDDFIKIFKESEGIVLHRVIRGALQFKNTRVPSEEENEMMARIVKNAEAALIKIGKESRLNEGRIKNHGIILKK